MPQWVYIIQSESSGRYYCGQSSNVQQRLRQHNDPEYRLSKTTKHFAGPWKLIWTKEYLNRSQGACRFLGTDHIRGSSKFALRGASPEKPGKKSIGWVSLAMINPAIVGKLSFEPSWAHMGLGGLYRRLESRRKGIRPGRSRMGGVTFSGRINTWGDDSLIWAFEYGNALGAYMQDTSGLDLDAAPVSSTNSALKPISAFGAWKAYQHWWSRSLRSTATYSFVCLGSNFDLWPHTAGTGTYKQTHYASMNLIWSQWLPLTSPCNIYSATERSQATLP